MKINFAIAIATFCATAIIRGEADCGDHDSCSGCLSGKDETCTWCSASIGIFGFSTHKDFPGVCRNGTEKDVCDDLEMGRLAMLMDITGDIISMKAVTTLDGQCSNTNFPPVLFGQTSCEACTSVNDAAGWCQISIARKDTVTTGGFCLPKEVPDIVCSHQISSVVDKIINVFGQDITIDFAFTELDQQCPSDSEAPFTPSVDNLLRGGDTNESIDSVPPTPKKTAASKNDDDDDEDFMPIDPKGDDKEGDDEGILDPETLIDPTIDDEVPKDDDDDDADDDDDDSTSSSTSSSSSDSPVDPKVLDPVDPTVLDPAVELAWGEGKELDGFNKVPRANFRWFSNPEIKKGKSLLHHIPDQPHHIHWIRRRSNDAHH